MKIQAAVLRAPHRRIEIEEVDLEPPQDGEVLVRLGASGVCHSDWHLVTGDTPHPMPVIIGHEGAGTVEAIGDGIKDLQIGDRVILNWAPSCGKCFYCLRGRPSLCSTFVDAIWRGTMLDGTTRLSLEGERLFHFCGLACFADRAVVPRVSCVKVAAELPIEAAALIGCAVTTGVGAVLNTARVRAGNSVAILGAGGVGLSIVLGAKLAGANPIIVSDPHRQRMEIAIAIGATHAASPGEALAKEIRNLTGGRGADYCFEAAGLPRLQEQCLEVTRPGGVAVFAGLSPKGSATNVSGAQLVRQEKTILGCYYGTSTPSRDFPMYAKLCMAGKLDLTQLISKSYPMAQINEAFEDMLAGKVARGLIVWPDPQGQV